MKFFLGIGQNLHGLTQFIENYPDKSPPCDYKNSKIIRKKKKGLKFSLSSPSSLVPMTLVFIEDDCPKP